MSPSPFLKQYCRLDIKHTQYRDVLKHWVRIIFKLQKIEQRVNNLKEEENTLYLQGEKIRITCAQNKNYCSETMQTRRVG